METQTKVEEQLLTAWRRGPSASLWLVVIAVLFAAIMIRLSSIERTLDDVQNKARMAALCTMMQQVPPPPFPPPPRK
jgi:hypothetical protein